MPIDTCTHTGYFEETKRLYSVIEIRLQDRDWLAGPGRGRYSIADLNVIPWIRFHRIAGIESLDQWPHLKVWNRYLYSQKDTQNFDNWYLFRHGSRRPRLVRASRLVSKYELRGWSDLDIENVNLQVAFRSGPYGIVR